MDPIILIASALWEGLIFVGLKLAEETVVASFEPAKEWLKTKLPVKYKEAPENARLAEIVRQALQQNGAPVEDKDQLLSWLQRNGLARLQAEGNHTLHRQVARSIIGYTNPHADPPKDLMIALAWPRSRKHELAELLKTLRAGLATLPEWKELVAYADRAASLDYLSQILATQARLEDAFVLTPQGRGLRIWIETQPDLSSEQAERIEFLYREGLRNEYRMHRVEGLVQVERIVELPLQDIYLDLGLIPHGSEKDKKEELEMIRTADEIKRIQYERGQVERRVNKALAENPQTVILGKPGSGKSITLKFIALMLAIGAPGASRLELAAPYLPLYVRLADYADKLRQDSTLALESFLLEYIQNHYPDVPRQREYLQMALQNGGCMILLDGLDEVADIGETAAHSQSIRTAVLQEVNRFAKRRCGQANTNRIIVTSRLEGYSWGDLSGFTEFEISPLRAPDEIEEFLLRWFSAYIYEMNQHKMSIEAAGRKARKDYVDDLMPRIIETTSILRLAINPLLLTVLAIIHQMGKQLPNRRVKLYQVVVRTMVENWRTVQTGHPSQIYQEIDSDKIYYLLAALAYWLHENQSGGTMPRDQWQQKIEEILRDKYQIVGAQKLVDDFLRHARQETGLLTERSVDQIGFFHLTLEEYMAAVEIAGQESDDERQAMVEKHWFDPYWQEVILLTAGELDQQNKLKALKNYLSYLLSMDVPESGLAGRPALLAGRALADVGLPNPNNTTHQSVLRGLRDAMQDLNPTNGLSQRNGVVPILTRAAAADLLDELGEKPDDLYQFVHIPPQSQLKPPLKEFWIGKYPVTNVQYARFLKEENFKDESLWTGFPKYGRNSQRITGEDWGDKPWIWLQEALNDSERSPDGKIAYPRFWHDPRFGIARKTVPVVGVTWYEAMAYCCWLARNWGDLEEGTANALAQPIQACLPTEIEWETAAGKPEWVKAGKEREWDKCYPWDAPGSVTRAENEIILRANTDESQIGRTTPVGMYPLGVSQPYGLWDLAGNVWEWQANYFNQEKGCLGLRGGSWSLGRGFARPSVRHYFNLPYGNWDGNGFRVVVRPS